MNDEKTIAKPTIHLNGTGPEDLARAYEEAASAVFKAREALVAASPNARDYYPQGDGAYERARREHDARCRKLAEVQDEVTALGDYVTAELDARRARRACQ